MPIDSIYVPPPTAPFAVDVRAWGAIGDGVTDDAAALQRAIDAAAAGGGNTYVSPGTYACGTPLLLPSNHALFGVPGRSVIRLRDGANCQLVANAHATDANIALRDLVLDGNRAHTTPGLSDETLLCALQGVTGLRIRDVRLVEASSVALWLANCVDVVVDGVAIVHPYKFGVFVSCQSGGWSEDVTLRHVRVTAAGRVGIVVDNGYAEDQSRLHAVRVLGCTVEDTTNEWDALAGLTGGGTGIDVEEGCDDVLVQGCTILRSRLYGLMVSGGQHAWPCRRTRILDNLARDAQQGDGFSLQLMRGGLVRGNLALGAAVGRGFVLSNCRDVLVQGNRAEYNAQHGFLIQDSNGCTVQDNYAVANSQASSGTSSGILLDGTGGAGLELPNDNRMVGNECRDGTFTLAGTDGGMTAGSAVLTVLAGLDPVGLATQAISVAGAGPAGATLSTTIVSIAADGLALTLAAAASSTVAAAAWTITRTPRQGYGLRITRSGSQPLRTVVDANRILGNTQAVPYADAGDQTVYGPSNSGYGLENYVAVLLDDDLATGAAALTQQVGSAGWLAVVAGSGSIAISAQQGHPGVRRLGTGATGTSTAALAAAGAATVHSNDAWDVTFWAKANQANGDADAVYRLGLAGTTTDPPTNGCYLDRRGGEANWFAVSRAAGVETRVSTGVAQDANYHRFRIRRFSDNGTTTIGCSIDDGTETKITTNIPTGQGFFPFAYVANGAAAADKQVDLDRARLVIVGAVR